MKELSLHILDIVQNSLSANSNLIFLTIFEDIRMNILRVSIEDNGRGMDKLTAEKIKDPFYTTRTERKVGLGIPLLLQAARRCNGDLTIDSIEGIGTKVTACFEHNHIDRAPMGNLCDTITAIIMCNEKVDIVYKHIFNGKEFKLDTKEIRSVLKEVPITSVEVIDWIGNYIKDGLKSLYGGVNNEID